MTHYPQDKTAKLVIRFEEGPLFSRGYFLKCMQPPRYSGHILHCPKGGRINESLIYIIYTPLPELQLVPRLQLFLFVKLTQYVLCSPTCIHEL